MLTHGKKCSCKGKHNVGVARCRRCRLRSATLTLTPGTNNVVASGKNNVGVAGVADAVTLTLTQGKNNVVAGGKNEDCHIFGLAGQKV